jgi:lysophospholipase L1-like esterase
LNFRKPWTTIALLLACAAATWIVPGLSAYRAPGPSTLLSALTGSWRGNPAGRLFRFPRPEPAKAVAVQAAIPPPTPRPSDASGGWPSGDEEDAYARIADGTVGIEDYGGVMARFYAALQKTEAKAPRAVTRISHFGDSPVTGDLITGDARARLQARFGDAGHGWIFVDRPWPWYDHRGVDIDGGGWTIRTAMEPSERPEPFGLGGASFSAAGSDARSRIVTGTEGRGQAVGRFDIHYQLSQKGGSFLASVDGVPVGQIVTASTGAGGLAVRSIPVADGLHELGIRPKGDGTVRLFGVVLEREVPGVVYDTLGANGATIRRLAHFDRAGWIESLKMRRPDLVILNYGTNESGDDWLTFAGYVKDYREVIDRLREALPGSAILLMAPMDRGVRGEGGGIGTERSIPRLVAAQRFIAREERVAFFDTYAAMGGSGTMAEWYARTPRLVAGDFTHPTRQGAAVVGDLLVDALLKGYANRQEPGSPDVEAKTR